MTDYLVKVKFILPSLMFAEYKEVSEVVQAESAVDAVDIVKKKVEERYDRLAYGVRVELVDVAKI